MFSKIKGLVLAGAVVVLAGCLETKQEVTLNPDSSGKVVFELKQPLDAMMNMNFDGQEQKQEPPEEKAKKEVAEILKNSKGVDAWEDVSYSIDDADNLVFKGTAYFKSYNNAVIGGQMKTEKSSQVKIDSTGMTVSWKQDKKKMGKPVPDKAAEPVQLSEKELAKQVRKTQLQLRQTLAMMGPMLGGFKDEITFRLPGRIDKLNNFKKIDDNTVSIAIDGEKILKVMQEFANDQDAIAKAVKQGEKDGPGDDYMNAKIFGNNGPIEAHASKLKPQFDYQKAVAEAEKKFPEMCKKIGIEVK